MLLTSRSQSHSPGRGRDVTTRTSMTPSSKDGTTVTSITVTARSPDCRYRRGREMPLTLSCSLLVPPSRPGKVRFEPNSRPRSSSVTRTSLTSDVETKRPCRGAVTPRYRGKYMRLAWPHRACTGVQSAGQSESPRSSSTSNFTPNFKWRWWAGSGFTRGGHVWGWRRKAVSEGRRATEQP